MALAAMQSLAEIGIEHQIFQAWVNRIGIGDFLQKARADDAAASPNLRQRPKIQVPTIDFLRLGHQLEPLGIGADF